MAFFEFLDEEEIYENERNDELFKKLSATIKDYQIQVLKLRFPSDNDSKEDILKYISGISSEEEINEILNEDFSVQKDEVEKNRKSKLFEILSDKLSRDYAYLNHDSIKLNGVKYYYNLYDKNKLIKALINSFDTEEEIFAFIKKRQQQTSDFLKKLSF